MWWSDLFTDMNPTDFFNFSFLPKYGTAFVRGIEYTLLLAVVSVLLAILPALGLALMRLSRKKPVRWLSGAYIAVFRSTPMLVQLSIIYYGLFYAISLPRLTLFGFVDISRFIPGVVALVYVLPVAAFLLGYCLSPGLAEGVRYAIAMGAAALMFVPIVAYDRYARRHETLTYTVVRRF